MITKRQTVGISFTDDSNEKSRTAVVQLCARTWDELAQTNHEGVRHCDFCSQEVFRVTSDRGFALAVAAGRCVWVPETSATSQGTIKGNFLGGACFVYDPQTAKLLGDE